MDTTQNPYADLNATDINAMLRFRDKHGNLQLHVERAATRKYFQDEINPNTVFFHSLEEKLQYLVENNHYDFDVLKKYDSGFIKSIFEKAYSYRFRFKSLIGALKYYKSYTLKTNDGKRYLERYEDRVVMNALMMGNGDTEAVERLLVQMMRGVYQPATPTFLNAGRKQRGELVSCFLLNMSDSMEAIGRTINSALQLSKRGGGVAINLSNLREDKAPIKGVEGVARGPVPVMKILEDSFSYADQLGARQGAGAIYIHACHPDVFAVLDTKRENADEKIRIKTLSVGVVIPDIVMKLAEQGKDYYAFSPYSIQKYKGKAFTELDIDEHYHELVEDSRIKKFRQSGRKLLQRIAELEQESGYPYIMFESNVNRLHPNSGRVNMSNLCVAPETGLLTDKGEFPIITLVDQTVNIWNGEEYSEVTVKKTGENQRLLTVTLSDGRVLDCTEYHKWYLQCGYGKESLINEVRTKDLLPGDKLIKWKAPLIEGSKEFPRAYVHGFSTGDGTVLSNGKMRIYLYGDKIGLWDRIGEVIQWRTGSHHQRLEAEINIDYPKFFVPNHEFTVQARLEWLAGWLDADGSIYRNGTNEAFVGSSIDKDFITNVQSMLLSLGINSKFAQVSKADFRMMPKNDGTGESAPYYCQDSYRLTISSVESQKLLELGLNTKRLTMERRELQRDAAQFPVVISVVDHGRISDTYCVSEPKQHRAVFNGILTGNCTEILQSSELSIYRDDLSYEHLGKDISCNLGSLNVKNAIEFGNLEETCEVAIRALSYVSDSSNINSVPSIANGNSASHAVGLGQMNLHGFLMSRNVAYGSPEAIEFTSCYFAAINYYTLLASNKLAKERKETYQGFEHSKYASGEYFEKYVNQEWLPTSDVVTSLFGDCKLPTVKMWTALMQEVMEHGLYNAYRQAVAPTGSISYINNSTACIHAITERIEERKEGKTGTLYYTAPELTDQNYGRYINAFDLGWRPQIDMYAAANEHVDQGLSLTLFFKAGATTRDLNLAHIYAWRKGIRTIYYVRLAAEEFEGCESCSV